MNNSRHPLRCFALLLCCTVATAAAQDEHSEFEATLHAPYRAPYDSRGAARVFTLVFDYPNAAQVQRVNWQLALIDARARVVRHWQGRVTLAGTARTVRLAWSGDAAQPLPAGIYQLRLRASSGALRARGAALTQQQQLWPIEIGPLAAPQLLPFTPLPTRGAARLAAAAPASVSTPALAPAAAVLPYTVYLGNLHSQTNHSDGGAELSNCHGAQQPQTAPYGPDTAFAYARAHGLDLLVTSEHNHMYDGAAAENRSADPARATGLYRQGLQMASAFNAAHPDFLAVYGLEWGVINQGGHVNIFNSDALLGWETNARGELLADVATARSDYAALYTLMRARGWVGQFNHPASSGQFSINGTALGYTPDGDAAMALCEVVNSTAFSNNDSEGETRRSNFEAACNKALEAGFHVAFSSNQDNHCANWGTAAANRTGVLIPRDTPLTRASFIAALQARRVFATMDKGSQLVLTANTHVMGTRFANRGSLNLTAYFASTTGKTVAAVAIMEGVPGRGGVVTQLTNTAQRRITPTPGAHFYYAKLTQSDGNMLWSAPVWVDQEEGTAPPPHALTQPSGFAGSSESRP